MANAQTERKVMELSKTFKIRLINEEDDKQTEKIVDLTIEGADIEDYCCECWPNPITPLTPLTLEALTKTNVDDEFIQDLLLAQYPDTEWTEWQFYWEKTDSINFLQYVFDIVRHWQLKRKNECKYDIDTEDLEYVSENEQYVYFRIKKSKLE